MDAGPLCREVHDLQLSAELSVASASAIESRGDAADNSFTVTGCRQLGVGFDFRRAGTASERMSAASALRREAHPSCARPEHDPAGVASYAPRRPLIRDLGLDQLGQQHE